MDVDVEAELICWLAGRFPTARVCTDLPADLQDVLPTIQVTRGPGGGIRNTVFDVAVMDVDVYAATRGDASDLARQVRAAIAVDLPSTRFGSSTVLTVDNPMPPHELPYDDRVWIRRFGAIYDLTIQSAF